MSEPALNSCHETVVPRGVGAFQVALVGHPNCGKTSLFNALTGGHAKVGNYSGVTVEKKVGQITLGNTFGDLVDLPGAYSLEARSLDEEVTRDVLLGKRKGESKPDVILAVVDSTQLQRGLPFVMELRELGIPMVLALNMVDLVDESELDSVRLSESLGVPVVLTSAVKRSGISGLNLQIEALIEKARLSPTPGLTSIVTDPGQIRRRFAEADRILSLVQKATQNHREQTWTDRIDRVVLHPIAGSLFLVALLGFIFQSIFNWAQVPMEAIRSGIGMFGHFVQGILPAGPLQGLLVDGVINGVGSVLVFLPQILLLFGFLLALEDSGYLPRAAFLMDQLMRRAGLNGKAFIPLLSSYACAIPGIMATRTIENRQDRLITILISPLMTCSARLPVYALLIGAFIPAIPLGFGFTLQGLVLFGLYLLGASVALGVAFLFKKSLPQAYVTPVVLELPRYRLPSLRNLAIGLVERARIFVRRAGSVILAVSVLLWFVSSYPKPNGVSDRPAIESSFAGRIGHWIEPALLPIGLNWKIGVALIPGLAAREVMIGSLATVYAVSQNEKPVSGEESGVRLLSDRLVQDWSVATGISLLIWYVFACQCLSTLAVIRRETQSWKWPLLTFTYMTVLAYGGAFVAYRLALWAGLG